MTVRTTLSLDDDVAVMLARVQKARRQSQKAVANEALRHGLRAMTAPERRRTPFRTQPLDLGRCLLPNLDNIEEVLDLVEGPLRKW